MTAAVVAIVVAGIATAIVLGVAAGMDTTAAVILGAIVALGTLAVAAAVRARRGIVHPGRCPGCGGLVSSVAPYCKHCGARRARTG